VGEGEFDRVSNGDDDVSASGRVRRMNMVVCSRV
jgi:hypothetical protein